jgi:DinB superfamily
MSPEERSRAIKYLEDTRKDFCQATAGLSEAQWNFREGPDRWSVADCAEHLAVSEAFIFGIFQREVVTSARGPGRRWGGGVHAVAYDQGRQAASAGRRRLLAGGWLGLPASTSLRLCWGDKPPNKRPSTTFPPLRGIRLIGRDS